jgi:hypothetical protein
MASLSGCSWFHQKSDVYSGAVESRPLEVPPDLDSPPNANELLVPQVGPATASGVAAANAAPAAPQAPTFAANQLLVADNAADTWTKVGPAIESAKVGVLSLRDENQRSFILDFNAPIPKPSAESHWYTAVFNHLGFGEGDPVKAHLLVRRQGGSGRIPACDPDPARQDSGFDIPAGQCAAAGRCRRGTGWRNAGQRAAFRRAPAAATGSGQRTAGVRQREGDLDQGRPGARARQARHDQRA